MTFDLIIHNATIVDGSGGKSFVGDVAIQGDKIAVVGTLPNRAKSVVSIDATGKVLTPGFIDIQNHSDSYWRLFDNPNLQSMLAQGITSILVGNCGASLAPVLSQQSLLAVQKWHSLTGHNISWNTFGEYIYELEKLPLGCNVGSLVGYATIRRGLIGDDVRSLEKNEIAALKEVIKKAMEEGAFGLSSGLSYSHEAIITELELFEVAQMVSKAGGLLSVHLRNEEEYILESLIEVLDIARQSDARLKISHFKIRGSSNAHLLDACLSEMEKAYQHQGNIFMDAYPYQSVWQVLYSYLPKWSTEGGRHAMLTNIKHATQRRKIIDYLNDKHPDLGAITIASDSGGMHMAGKTIGEIAEKLTMTPAEALLRILETGGPQILAFQSIIPQAVLDTILFHPQTAIATDGAGFSQGDGIVHPRCFNTTLRFIKLGLHAQLSLEELVFKMTELPARIWGLKNRGTIVANNYADLVLFDLEKVKGDTLLQPYAYPAGMEKVFVNGTLAFEQGNFYRPTGKVLRK